MNDSAFGKTLLVTGSDELLGERAVSACRTRALKERPDAQVNELMAEQLETTMLSEMIGESLFASETIAIIDDLGSCPSAAAEQLLAVAKDPGEDLCLILRHRGGVKGKGLLDKLKKAKVPTEAVVAPKAWELPKFITAEARRHKVSLSQDAAEALRPPWARSAGAGGSRGAAGCRFPHIGDRCRHDKEVSWAGPR
ncbi:MAG: hypothetical protein R2722_17450 [Tessaracoccus sp.]